MNEFQIKLQLDEPYVRDDRANTATFICDVIRTYTDQPIHYIILSSDFLIDRISYKIAVVRNRYVGEEQVMEMLKCSHRPIVVTITLLNEGTIFEKNVLDGQQELIAKLDMIGAYNETQQSDWRNFIGTAKLL
jgi:hypothetical protein